MDLENIPTSRCRQRSITPKEFLDLTYAGDPINLNITPTTHLREFLQQLLQSTSSAVGASYMYHIPLANIQPLEIDDSQCPKEEEVVPNAPEEANDPSSTQRPQRKKQHCKV